MSLLGMESYKKSIYSFILINIQRSAELGRLGFNIHETFDKRDKKKHRYPSRLDTLSR
jgi:hypothetical protein